jgi:hypothetical protein
MIKAFVVALAVVGIGIIAGAKAVFNVRTPGLSRAIDPVWTETRWPFLTDQWGNGKAFVCAPTDCGVKVNVYVRPKIGFCNCSTGVSDDAELERVGDTDLVSRGPGARGPGRPIKVGWMHGRSRHYAASDGDTGERLLSVAFNDECDVVVALATFGDADPAPMEAAIVGFLNSNPMVVWAKKELGLEFMRREW